MHCKDTFDHDGDDDDIGDGGDDDMMDMTILMIIVMLKMILMMKWMTSNEYAGGDHNYAHINMIFVNDGHTVYFGGNDNVDTDDNSDLMMMMTGVKMQHTDKLLPLF